MYFQRNIPVHNSPSGFKPQPFRTGSRDAQVPLSGALLGDHLQGYGSVRIPLGEDRRVFTPVARSSYRWQNFYNQRGAVERVNSRLAGRFGFERPGIRGLAKMQRRISMAVTIMLAMALGRIRAGQPENLRSLVRPA